MRLVLCTFVSLLVPGAGIRSEADLIQDLQSAAEAESYDSTNESWWGLLPRQKCRSKSKTKGGLVRRSCTKSWEKAGRCRWAEGDGCMTNCRHPWSQKLSNCDPTDCEWFGEAYKTRKCLFKGSTLAARQDFCGSVESILSKDQAKFCEGVTLAAAGSKLGPMTKSIDIMDFMGCWYVQANIPTFLDKGSSNNIELYTWNAKKKRIDVTFKYTKNGKDILSYQKGWLDNEQSTLWRLHPRLLWIYWPFNLPYVLIHTNADFTESVIGYPDRSYLWIMTREVNPNATKVDNLIRIAEDFGYKRENINMVQNNIPKTPEICPQ